MTPATGPARRGLSRPVVFAGIALGTFVTVTAFASGYRPPASGLAALLAGALTWLLLAALAVTVLEVLRRHHRAIGRAAVRHGRRGAVVTARAARRHGGTVRAWLVSKAGPRWENREHQPLMFRRLREPEAPADPAQVAPTAGAGTSPPPHDTDGGTTTMTTSKIAPERRARRAARSGGSVPSEWAPAIAQTADFEPEDDGELLEWMTRQLTGLSGWAEALVDFYEHCTQVIGIDPKASAMLHDVADAAAQAAETMGAAKARFTEHYELPREFAANGGLMTHDGRWVTGEGA
jgi:hypothetical protein